MAMTAADPPGAASRALLPLWVGAAVYALLMAVGHALLHDPDTLWQIRLGQEILTSHAVPRSDIYSFTMQGQPWISTQWLAQLLYALAHQVGGWTGVVALAAGAIALTFAWLAHALARRLSVVATLLLVTAAFSLAAPHLVARPHVLALPVMVAWVAALIAAADRGAAPPFRLLPLIVLWANLHGGFVFGLALVAPIALDAVINADAQRRRALLLRWALFGVAALLASGLTPYGWQALLAAKRILDLGDALKLITEWRPADFSRFGMFELCLLAMFGLSWWRGVTLPPIRIVLLLGLVHMALGAARNQEVFALLAPLVVAAPLARQFAIAALASKHAAPRWSSGAVVAIAVATLGAGTLIVGSFNLYAPDLRNAPVAAVDELQRRGINRVLNDYDFGGYLIARGVPTFIDGRTELYGADFVTAYSHATDLSDPAALHRLLADHNIEATLLRTGFPATSMLDRMEGWQNVYSDAIATLHVRAPRAAGDHHGQAATHPVSQGNFSPKR